MANVLTSKPFGRKKMIFGMEDMMEISTFVKTRFL